MTASWPAMPPRTRSSDTCRSSELGVEFTHRLVVPGEPEPAQQDGVLAGVAQRHHGRPDPQGCDDVVVARGDHDFSA